MSSSQKESFDEDEQQTNEEQTKIEQQQQPTISASNHEHFVVGIGASAGGLNALREFFEALPNDTGMVFVVIVHLSPEHESILADLLQAHTDMPVEQVNGHLHMQPNHVYVIPPAKRLLVNDGSLDLTDLSMPRGYRVQIDIFFRSLASHHGDGAAIILSGAGSDGSLGIQSIKEHGGLILVQDPAEAEYDSMPIAAIATGLVDLVAPVAELADHLVAAKQIGSQIDLPADPQALPPETQDVLAQILAHLQVRTGHSMTGYKNSTLMRRISRRMKLVQKKTFSAYLQHLRQDVDEADALQRDLLIHVTEFFRDPEAWQALADTVIPQLFEGKDADGIVRAWTVGCASGEEAYGLAMLLQEYADTLVQPPAIQVFASDIGELALDFARNGLYPEAIATNVSEERLEQFFIKQGNHFKVREELRDMVLFTPHNLIQDPPFSKLDLIVCRNLLIYLKRSLQERIFETFHYALHSQSGDSGYLFLGVAESPEGVTDLFDTISKRHHIYRRSQQHSGQLLFPTPTTVVQRQRQQPPAVTETPTRTAEEHRRQVEIVGPPSILVDARYRVLHLSNEVGRYLQHPDGMLTDEVFQLVRPELGGELRTALFRALEVGKGVLTRPVAVRFNGASHLVTMQVRPAERNAEQPRALVFFLEDETPVEDTDTADVLPTHGEDQAALKQLQSELAHAQRQLQTLREEYETTVEELHAANEELQSTNEEYRSTLEELETSKEELQSINEELQTVNFQLQNKMEETSQAHNDLQNLLTATEIATLFLDRKLRVKLYTPAAAELFNLMPPDINRPIGHLRGNLHYPMLQADIRSVLKDLTSVQREVQLEETDGASGWFLVNVRPYRTKSEGIGGVVVTFVDISAGKESELALQRSQERFRLLMENVEEYAIFMLDTEGRIDNWNVGAEHIFGYTEEEMIGKSCDVIFTEADQAAHALQQEMQVAQDQGQADDDRWHVRKDGSQFWASGIMVALTHADGSLRGYAKLLRDNTERKEAEEKLLALNESLEKRVQQRTRRVRELVKQLALSEQVERRRIAQILHDDLQQRLYALQFQLSSLQADLETPAKDRDEASMLRLVGKLDKSVAEAIEETRNLSVSLSPPILKGEGLPESLRWLATQMQQQHGLRVELQMEDDFPALDKDLSVLLFQVINELLFNVVKHAGVDEARAILSYTDDLVHIEVRDQGTGFDSKAVLHDSGSRRGLFGSSQRLESVGGTIDIEAVSEGGSLVIIECPRLIDSE